MERVALACKHHIWRVSDIYSFWWHTRIFSKAPSEYGEFLCFLHFYEKTIYMKFLYNFYEICVLKGEKVLKWEGFWLLSSGRKLVHGRHTFITFLPFRHGPLAPSNSQVGLWITACSCHSCCFATTIKGQNGQSTYAAAISLAWWHMAPLLVMSHRHPQFLDRRQFNRFFDFCPIISPS